MKAETVKTGLKRFTISLFLGANICTILLLWLCVGLTFISPDFMPRLSLLTLAFPIFLIVDILFIFFWLLFHARLVWVPILGALLVGSYILDYSPLNFSGKSDKNNEASDSTLTIITFNVGHMLEEEQKEEFMRYISNTDADIVCLQELSTKFISNHKDWFNSTHFHYLQSANVAIFSRFPFLSDTINIHYPTRSNRSIACWIDCFGDSLLVVNNHLESNHFSMEERVDYTNAITVPDRQAIKHSSLTLMNKMSEAAAYRGKQADSICSLIDRNAEKNIIVCGDLNETPISYTYQRLARRLNSAYREKGFGPGFTFSQRSFPVRIDHFFYSSGLECSSCCIDKSVSSSDHYPLIVRLGKKVH